VARLWYPASLVTYEQPVPSHYNPLIFLLDPLRQRAVRIGALSIGAAIGILLEFVLFG